jgi:hypothetical protein
MRKRIIAGEQKVEIATTFYVWTTTTKIVVVGQFPKALCSQLMASDDHILYVVVSVWSLMFGFLVVVVLRCLNTPADDTWFPCKEQGNLAG